MLSLITVFLFTVVFITCVHAVDDLCIRSSVRTCSDNTALEALFLSHGPIYTLNCNFTLSATLDGITFPYSLRSFDPTNLGDPLPNAGFGLANQGPTINFTLIDKKIDAYLAPYPSTGYQGNSYHEALTYNKDADQYGSSNVTLMDGISGSESVEIEGSLKWQCIDGAITLVLIQPYGKIFVTDSGAFQRGYSATWLVDDINGRASNADGDFKKIDVVVHILYGQ